MPFQNNLSADELFAGPGEMRALFRAFDWASTPLGPVASWPSSLQTTARTIMASRHPMFLWWGDNLVQIFNDAYRPSFGEDGRHVRAIGAGGKDFWTEIWATIGPQIEQVMSGGAATWHENQYLPIFRNGKLEDVYWSYSYSPAYGDNGEIAGVLVVVQETTKQVQLQKQSDAERAQADAARAEADAANKAKGDFLAMLSHELRTPLAAISGYADLLTMEVKGALTDGQKQYLSRIQHSQRHLLGLIDGLLIYSQAEAGKTQFHPEHIGLRELIASCEALIAPQADARQLKVNSETCDIDPSAFADLEKTQQILINLLNNAIKFTEPGGTIVVHCNMHDAVVTIAVADTGVGIAPEDLKRIFEPFVQATTNRTRGQGGTGLGLAISLMLARGMGGDLTVESTLGAGSKFTLTLPISEPLAAV